MRLVSVRIQNFRNILDSTPVRVEPDVTCVVGKNESGKSAFLQALHRLKPARANVAVSSQQQYPAWLEKQHRRRGDDLEEFAFVEAEFELSGEEMSGLEERFGSGVIEGPGVVARRQYDNEAVLPLKVKEAAVLARACDRSALPKSLATEAKKADTLAALRRVVEGWKSKAATSPEHQAGLRLEATLADMLGDTKTVAQAVINAVWALVPGFFYFDEYSALPGTINIVELLKKDRKSLTESETTARALLEQAGAEHEYLTNADYELRKRELENVANAITQEVLAYWSTNSELRVLIDITQKTVQHPHNGQQSVLDQMKIRLWDDRHLLSLPFDQRSTGFRWFFSFLAAFSEFEHSTGPMVILLDEPGLGLHARAQADFLRFIDERLAARCQVIYTTHSPFMVQPRRLERVRLVEDRGRSEGSRITADVLATDADTLFPLQGALGYELAQHLFVAPHSLVVEGTSDFTYLVTLSSWLEENGRGGLDPRWSVVPVGGADQVPTFVALLGNRLDVTVLVDARRAGHQRLAALAQDGLLSQNRILTVGDVMGLRLADIEDVFAPEDYLAIFNGAFGRAVKADELRGEDPIVNRLARHMGVDRYDHGRPADYLLRRKAELLPRLSSETLDRFERLFARVNATLSGGRDVRAATTVAGRAAPRPRATA